MGQLTQCCFCVDHFLGVKIIAALFLLKDVSIATSACAAMAIPSEGKNTWMIGSIIAFSVLYVFSALMLLIGAIERSPEHFLPFLITHGARILVILSLILNAVIGGQVLALGFVIGVAIYVYLWVVVKDLYDRLDEYKAIEHDTIHM